METLQELFEVSEKAIARKLAVRARQHDLASDRQDFTKAEMLKLKDFIYYASIHETPRSNTLEGLELIKKQQGEKYPDKIAAVCRNFGEMIQLMLRADLENELRPYLNALGEMGISVSVSADIEPDASIKEPLFLMAEDQRDICEAADIVKEVCAKKAKDAKIVDALGDFVQLAELDYKELDAASKQYAKKVYRTTLMTNALNETMQIKKGELE